MVCRASAGFPVACPKRCRTASPVSSFRPRIARASSPRSRASSRTNNCARGCPWPRGSGRPPTHGTGRRAPCAPSGRKADVMCGIAGEMTFDQQPVLHDSVRLMTDALTHRGPDEGAVRLLGPGLLEGRATVGLGHRRLKVIDLTSAAAQPMRDPLDRGCLVYNGELYNAAEVRRELEGRGVRFRSRSDTEVVLMALLTFPLEEALQRFNGMFALAFWDAAQGRLILARDRFGEKPLYYARTPGRILFASEIEGLVARGDVPLEVDDEAVELFLTLGYIPAPWSIYRA